MKNRKQKRIVLICLFVVFGGFLRQYGYINILFTDNLSDETLHVGFTQGRELSPHLYSPFSRFVNELLKSKQQSAKENKKFGLKFEAGVELCTAIRRYCCCAASTFLSIIRRRYIQ
eukprot:maker-scaffold_44-snap-gene-0.48-mRNA-1 protein AED:0.00 eAED:0.00 QI:17/1/1/1/0/0/2/1619/115